MTFRRGRECESVPITRLTNQDSVAIRISNGNVMDGRYDLPDILSTSWAWDDVISVRPGSLRGTVILTTNVAGFQLQTVLDAKVKVWRSKSPFAS